MTTMSRPCLLAAATMIRYSQHIPTPAWVGPTLTQHQAQIMIHEMSHMASIRTNRCLDYGTGFAEIMKLSREDALMNSDTYAMYASHVYKDCHRSRRPEVIAPPQIVVEDPVIIGDSVFPEDDSMAFAVGLEEDIVIGFLKSAANGGRTVGGGFFLVMAWLAMLYMCVLWG